MLSCPKYQSQTLQTESEWAKVLYAWIAIPVILFWVFIMNFTALACFTHVCWSVEKINSEDRLRSYLFCFYVYCSVIPALIKSLASCYSIVIHCNVIATYHYLFFHHLHIIPTYHYIFLISFLLILALFSRMLRWQCLGWYPVLLVHGKIQIVQLDLTGPPFGNVRVLHCPDFFLP